MTVVVTGAHGFIGKNLLLRLTEAGHPCIPIGSDADQRSLEAALSQATVVIHLAGANRPQHPEEFSTTNVGFTETVCVTLARVNPKASVVFASSVHADKDTPYGISKRQAEDVLRGFVGAGISKLKIFRLANVFGKWALPNYNSAVATFCHNTARGLELTINDATAPLTLVHIDAVCDAFLSLVSSQWDDAELEQILPVYPTTVGEVAAYIQGFRESRRTLTLGAVGTGFLRALYSTYLSYLPPEAFAYDVPIHADARGVFVEMLKTEGSGQFSYFTAAPGVTRGQHYHHTKTEKFLVLSGEARFGFRHITSGECHQITTRGGDGRIVETIPGWTHDITNVGDQEMVVMLWANEIFDRSRPDTIALKV